MNKFSYFLILALFFIGVNINESFGMDNDTFKSKKLPLFQNDIGNPEDYKLSEAEDSIVKMINDYHKIPKTDLKLLENRIKALEEIKSASEKNGIKSLSQDASEKLESLTGAVIMLSDKVPIDDKNFRRIILSYVKNFVGISSKGIGVTAEGSPLVDNNCMSNEFKNYNRKREKTSVKDGSVKGDEVRDLEIKDGLLVDTLPLAKSKPISIDSIYVMDADGTIYVGNCEQEDFGPFHHPMFTLARPVICGGHISIQAGKIKRIDNTSGHYMPTIEHLYYCLKDLLKKQVFAEDALIAPNLGAKNTDTIMALVKLGGHNITINPDAKPYIDYNLPKLDETKADTMFIELAKKGVKLKVGYSLEMNPKDFVENYSPPTGEDSWRYKVMAPTTHQLRYNIVLENIMKFMQKDNQLKQMVLLEMLHQKGVEDKVKIFSQHLKKSVTKK